MDERKAKESGNVELKADDKAQQDIFDAQDDGKVFEEEEDDIIF